MPFTHKRWSAWLCIVMLCLGAANAAQAQTVRGQIVFRNGYPAGGTAVRVFRQDLGASGYAYTGPDGMYYLNGIPPGNYQLQVFYDRRPMPAWQIRVHQQPMTDIPPYTLPF
jgi:hypothetical protein